MRCPQFAPGVPAVAPGRSARCRFPRRGVTRSDGKPTPTDQWDTEWRARLLEGRQAGDVLAEDQRVDVVGALVGEDRLQVAHVAAGLVLVGDPVRAEEVSRRPRDLE